MRRPDLWAFINLRMLICCLMMLIPSIPAYGEGMLKVTKGYRVSHPAYSMSNYWYTYYSTFNVDNSRILMYESGITVDKTFDKIYHPYFTSSRDYGRGVIWGCLTASCVAESAAYSTLQGLDLDNASGNQSLIDWDNNTFAVPSRYKILMHWSPYPDETNILYALNRYTKMLVTYNADTGVETPIISYDHPNGVANAELVGFSKDAVDGHLGHRHQIVINLDDSSRNFGDTLRIYTGRQSNGSFINPRYCTDSAGCTLTTATVEQYASSCDTKMQWYPYPHQVHSAVSPDGLYTANEDAMFKNDFNKYTCQATVGGGTGTPYYGQYWWWDNIEHNFQYGFTHVNWGASDDWYIIANNTKYPFYYQVETSPRIAVNEQRIWQVFFDRPMAHNVSDPYECSECFTHNLLISRTSATGWYESQNKFTVNYHALALPSISKDGTLLKFQGTNGKYTREDKSWCDKITPNVCAQIGNNWEGTGTYVAVLVPASGAQTCTSFTYSAWNECQPNGTQTRTVTASYPSGCTGGNPAVIQSCTYNPGSTAYTIKKIYKSPAIDGNLGEYVGADIITFAPSSGSNTVTVKALWDEEALYIGVNVVDTQINAAITSDDGDIWKEDSIEWFIDTYYDGGGSVDPKSVYMRVDDYQGIVNVLNTHYDSQGSAYGFPSTAWNGAWQSAVKVNGTVNNNSDSDSGYTVEIKIPWKSIGYFSAPSDWAIVGMSFAVNDKDASGFSSIMWPNIVAANQNASNWQKVELSGKMAASDAVPPAPPVGLMIAR